MNSTGKAGVNKSMKDTGERMIPAYHKGHMVYGEHIVRYEAAKELLKNKVVLDIASGSGYGTNLISQYAKSAVGVDVDPIAIKYANKNYSDSKTSFLHGDGDTIPCEDNYFDVVISFETIEHIENYDKFVAEIFRVLKKDGLFILSTPNDLEFPEGNHYHVHEFVEKELDTLVAKYFKHTKKYYQTTWLYNLLSDKSDLSNEWYKEIPTLQTAPTKVNRALYFFLLCSNRNITEKVTPKSAISEHWSARSLEEYEKSIRDHINDQAKLINELDLSLKIMNGRYKRLEGLYNKLSKIKNIFKK